MRIEIDGIEERCPGSEISAGTGYGLVELKQNPSDLTITVTCKERRINLAVDTNGRLNIVEDYEWRHGPVFGKEKPALSPEKQLAGF